MQRRIAEDGVELVRETEFRAIHYGRDEAALLRRIDLRGARVDPDDVATHLHQRRRQRTVTAAEIEDSLAGLRSQKLQDGHSKLGDEASVFRIALRVPRLRDRHWGGSFLRKRSRRCCSCTSGRLYRP